MSSQPNYPVSTPIGGQNSVISVVVGYIDTNGVFVAASAANGLPTAGGGGGGGGGAVTQAAGSVASGAYVAGAMVDGAIVTLGAEADVSATSDGGTFSLIALFKRSLASLTSLIAVFAPATQVTSTASESSHVLKASAGKLYNAVVYNGSALTQWYQLHDAASAPTAGAVPKMTLKVAPGGTGSFDYGLRGRVFGTGIFITNSTTALTYTAGAADSFYDASIQ